MNRLNQLRSTLLANLNAASSCSNVEFLILDYNSQDGIEDWAKKTLMPFIDAGILNYYRILTPQVFSHSHSKNLAFRLASGNILCNVNADHFLGTGFVEYINSIFFGESNVVLSPLDVIKLDPNYRMPKDIGGKVCLHKKKFEQVRGFDERMTVYGFEDMDFVNRLFRSGCSLKRIENLAFLNFLQHEDSERFISGTSTTIESIFVHYSSEVTSKVVIFYIDSTFEIIEIIDELAKLAANIDNYFKPIDTFHFNKTDTPEIIGSYEIIGNLTKLVVNDGSVKMFHYNSTKCQLTDLQNDDVYYKIADPDLISQISSFNIEHKNRTFHLENLHKKPENVNQSGFGQGTVYKNFDYSQPIILK